MSKEVLPVLNICSLQDKSSRAESFMADELEHYLSIHNHLHIPHKHSFYHLIYFTKGAGSNSIDFVNFPVTPGQIYFMVPGQVHSCWFEGEPEGFVVNFIESYIQALVTNPRYLQQFTFFSGIANEQAIAIPEEGRQQIIEIFETIVSEGKSDQEQKDDMIRTALIQLFIQVSRYTGKNEKNTNNYNSTLLRNFQKLIDQHYKEKKLTKDYAAMLYVTPNHLNALSKDVTGRPAGELIRDRILLEAKILLVNAEMNVSQIATELDFSDNSYFSKFFKKYTGLTPEAFRKQILK
jgi:AraC family transcriptional regulator, transcriptional activator of pobA